MHGGKRPQFPRCQRELAGRGLRWERIMWQVDGPDRLLATVQLVHTGRYFLAIDALQIVVQPAACDHFQFEGMNQLAHGIFLYKTRLRIARRRQLCSVVCGGVTCLHSAEKTTKSLDKQRSAALGVTLGSWGFLLDRESDNWIQQTEQHRS